MAASDIDGPVVSGSVEEMKTGVRRNQSSSNRFQVANCFKIFMAHIDFLWGHIFVSSSKICVTNSHFRSVLLFAGVLFSTVELF